ncbi:MAG TPA: hypothetical protein VGM70_01240 [Pseudolysinimonas sp.]
MPIRALAVAALATLFVLGAPLAAHADVSHDSTLSGTTAQVAVDAEPANAGKQASVEILRVGAQYSAPKTADIVYLNEYTLDAAGTFTFNAVIPGGTLDDYVIAVKVAGATSRYLASLDPNGPVPVNPGGGGGGPGATGPSGAGNPLAITGVAVPIGVLLLAVAGVIVGAALLRRRRSRA